MKRLMVRLHRMLMFVLSLMPLSALAFQALTKNLWLGPAWLAAQTALAALLTLLPAYVGNYHEYEVITHEGSVGLDPNPDREARHELVREGKRFPVRLFADLAVLGVQIAVLILLPQSFFIEDSGIRKFGFSAMVTLLLLIAMRDLPSAQCLWADIPGVFIGAVGYFILAIYLKFASSAPASLNTLIAACAVAYLFLGALTLNSQSIAQSMSAHDGEARRAPRQIGRRNRNIVLIFAGAVTLVSLVSPIRAFVLWCLARVGAFVKMVSAAIRALFGGNEAAEELAPEMFETAAAPAAAEVAEAAESSLFSDILVYAFLGVVAIGFVWLIFDRIRALVNKLTKWLEKFAAGVNEGFYDEREQLMSAEEMRDQLKQRFRDRVKRLLARETPWAQLDGRARARRLLKEYYKRRARHVSGLGKKTAREAIYETGAARPDAFSDAYERARYSEGSVDAQEMERLKKDLKL